MQYLSAVFHLSMSSCSRASRENALNMSPKPILYDLPCSPPVRAVKMLAKAIDLPLHLKQVDSFRGEHISEKFMKINPTHTVPALDDNGTLIWDSHAIMAYLSDKYGKNDALYPKDIVKRTEVNQILFFDVSVMGKLSSILIPTFTSGVKSKLSKEQLETFEGYYDSIERILQGKYYMTGNQVTLADISMVATLSSVGLLAPLDPKKYPRIAAWMKRMEGLECYEANVAGFREHAGLIGNFFEK